MRAWGPLLLVASTAHADDHPFEASAFVGVGTFSDDSELGNSWAPDQIPNTSPLVGARLGWVALPRVVGALDGVHLAAVIEGEFSLATAFTGDTSESMTDRTRASYFAPVFGWRGHAMLQLAGLGRITPHLLAGGGGETVASSSPYMTKETDSVFYWGPGVSIGLAERWRVRLDLRHGVMAARDDGMTSTFEAQLGLVARFGGATRRPVIVIEPTREPVEPERLDPPVVVAPDVDGDGLVGAADHCPDAAEDFDKWADDDGCPDLDNDEDGIEDARDACPLEPETRNGVADADGCPDAIPDDVTHALAAAGKLTFEANRARVTPAAQTTLRPLYRMLVAHPEVKIRIVGRPDKPSGADLAKRRADAVKWWLVDQGVTEGRIAISLGEVGTPALELVLRAE